MQVELFYTIGEKDRVQGLTKEISEVEGSVVVNEGVTQNWSRRVKKGDINLEDKPRSQRHVMEDEILLEKVRQQPNTSTRILSTELRSSRCTINQHLYKLGFVNRRCQEALYQPTNDQAQ